MKALNIVIIILAVSMEFFRNRGQLDQATP